MNNSILILTFNPKRLTAVKHTYFHYLVLLALLLNACKSKSPTSDPSTVQLTNEVTAIDTYLSSDSVDYIIHQANGVRIAVKSFGNGPIPHSGQGVRFEFLGKLFSNKTVVDSGYYNGLLDNIGISGLQSAFISLPEGSVATVYIPSQYGYGANGTSKVPGNATLAYDVTFQKVSKTSTEQAQFDQDTASIHQYLISKNISALLDSSGVWYSVDSGGTGPTMTPFYNVNTLYEAKVLSTGKSITPGTLTSQSLLGLIDGVRIGFGHMKVGNIGTFYIPSGLAYGPNGQVNIPSNANLIFSFKLNAASK
jgi:FKBP-type peptidyl-prolyl cis-trans isomerase FkpA